MSAENQPVADAGASTDGPELSTNRRVFNLAWPVIGENFLETTLGIVDTFLVARLGAAAIAGVGSSLQVMFFVIAALSALSVGSSVLVAQAVGARKFERASHLARQSIVWSVCFSVPLALLGFFLADPILSVFGLEPEVAAIASDYLKVTMGTVVVLVVLFIGGGVLRGAGDSRTPMQVTALANVVNIFLTYGLIFGVWGLPELGAVGSAWATFLSRLLAAVILLWAMSRGRNGVTIGGRNSWLPEIPVARSVLQIGVPAAVEQVLISAAFTVLTIVVAGLGTGALAAHRIAFNALSLSFLPGFGFSIAATALVGQSVGARRLQEGSDAAHTAARWGAMWMGAMAVVFFLLATPIMQAFTDEAEVIRLGASSLRVLAFSQPFWALLFVYSGSLRGLGNTNFPLRVNTLGIWGTVLLSWLVVSLWNGGLAEVWAAFILTSPVMAFVLFRRFRNDILNAPAPQPVAGD
ncbi:MAG: MATE family efflux transporter [Caldilineaceae bacterium]|nr:MATE family efflux transporter [Caldilineaceae bacterium]